MFIAVVSPQRRAAGATSVAALIGAELSKQNRSTLLLNSAAHSDSFNLYFGVENTADSPAQQLINLVKMGGAKKESIPDYCHAVNNHYDVFTVEEKIEDKTAVNEVHDYLVAGAPYNYIIMDIDTDMDDERTEKYLQKADCVVLVLDSGVKNLMKFADMKKEFTKLVRHKPIVTVLNDYDQEVLKKEEAAALIRVTNKKSIALWGTVHYNKYIPYCENRGALQLLFAQMAKRTSQTIMLDTDINIITKQIIKIQTEQSRARINAKLATQAE